jgi:CHASE2 domain-containing sensor protein
MLGTLLNERYRLISELGAGGFGQTYLAEDMQQPDGFHCVVKQFKPASQDAKFLEIARRLFDTETATLRRLGQHDQIPQLLDFFEEDQEFYIVQEFIDGQPLSEELSHRSHFSEPEVLALLQDVLEVLQFVHSSHVIHRDIKPGNLIRRHQDDKFVLIDFGAVKEINTQLLSRTGQTNLTVGIGTQGYTPSEQLAGKPRYSSDLYALGMTAIHALTGFQPSQLPEDSETCELLWQEYADVGVGLAFVLNRMVRSHVTQRYQSAIDVLQALQHLSEMPTDMTDIPPSMLLPDYLIADCPSFPLPQDWRKTLKIGLKIVAIATAAVTGLLVGARQLGWLEPLELRAFDQMVRLSNKAADPDPRLLIVAISEADLRSLQRTTPSDQSVAQVLKVLQQYQPKVIGLDLHRDLPQQPGHTELLRQLQSPNIVVITELGTSASTRISPPPGVPVDRVGFNDIATDPSGIVRRNLMFATNEVGTFYSFSLQVALKYLADQEIFPHDSSVHPDFLQLGSTTYLPLEKTSGGYQNADAGGYQILLRYRTSQAVAQQVAFTDVLNGKIDSSWVKGKIVLIGTTAPSAKDLFYTPFSATEQTVHQMSGVIIHAQMVSQILTTALDGQPLFWFWSDGIEVLWIVSWAFLGGGLAWYLRHPAALGAAGMVVLGGLAGVSFLIFMRQGWVPVAAPAIALITTGGAVVVYRIHQIQRQQQDITQLYSRSDTGLKEKRDRLK